MSELIDDLTPYATAPLAEAGRELLFTQARTASTFSAEPVTDAELAGIWELAKWAPTAANTQPLRVVFVRTEEGKARLVPHLAEGNRAKAQSAPVVAVLAMDTEFHEYVPELLPFRPELKDVYAADDGARIATAEFNTALQSGYFVLAVRAQGLAAGPMGGFDHAGVDAEFFEGGRFKSVLVVNIGHPGVDPWFDRLPRLADEQVLTWA
ncbi:malonic semialdehyde reductase [Rhodococcus kronopolitis]|uniref:Malonic semialdehyde reductase n=1 Tax=Rhodococcus kronopolitis TaxID=1460226 RepID=A0ABV9FPH8_9NOCA